MPRGSPFARCLPSARPMSAEQPAETRKSKGENEKSKNAQGPSGTHRVSGRALGYEGSSV